MSKTAAGAAIAEDGVRSQVHLVGTWGLEPQTSSVSILKVIAAANRKNGVALRIHAPLEPVGPLVRLCC